MAPGGGQVDRSSDHGGPSRRCLLRRRRLAARRFDTHGLHRSGHDATWTPAPGQLAPRVLLSQEGRAGLRERPCVGLELASTPGGRRGNRTVRGVLVRDGVGRIGDPCCIRGRDPGSLGPAALRSGRLVGAALGAWPPLPCREPQLERGLTAATVRARLDRGHGRRRLAARRRAAAGAAERAHHGNRPDGRTRGGPHGTPVSATAGTILPTAQQRTGWRRPHLGDGAAPAAGGPGGAAPWPLLAASIQAAPAGDHYRGW